MEYEPPISSEVFVTDPDNVKFVEGSASFEDVQQEKLHSARTTFLATFAAFAAYVILRLFLPQLSGIVFLVAFVAFLLMIRALYNAWIARQLAKGEFIEARVFSSSVAHYHGTGRQSGGGQFLSVTYEFNSPSGKHIRKLESVRRNDMRLRAVIPGTPVVVCYVSDRFFRLM